MGRARLPAKTKPPFVRRGAIVRTQRISRGLTRKQLAMTTGLSYRTLAKVERGDSVSDDVLAIVAKELGLDFELLKYEAVTSDDKIYKYTARTNVRMRVERPYEKMSQVQVYERFQKSLVEVADAASAVILMLMERGSTILVLNMSYRDIHLLCQAYDEGRLKRLNVSDIRIELPMKEIVDLRRDLLLSGRRFSLTHATEYFEFLFRKMAVNPFAETAAARRNTKSKIKALAQAVKSTNRR
jgi:transcriptional regulator with XRE-family HTH domain